MTTATAVPLQARASLFRGLAEPSRLRILDALRDGERTVSEICEVTELTQSNASNHLACLLGCRLVTREQRGRRAFYRLAHDQIETLLTLGDEVVAGLVPAEGCCPVCGSHAA